MTHHGIPNKRNWQEQDSQAFIDFGHYFVPDREIQIQIICDLIPSRGQTFHIIELCCGGTSMGQSRAATGA